MRERRSAAVRQTLQEGAEVCFVMNAILKISARVMTFSFLISDRAATK